MLRLALFVAGIALFAMSSADAAARHKHKVPHPAVAPSVPVLQPAFANRPAWAAPPRCYTNDGYGRFLPCDIGDGR